MADIAMPSSSAESYRIRVPGSFKIDVDRRKSIGIRLCEYGKAWLPYMETVTGQSTEDLQHSAIQTLIKNGVPVHNPFATCKFGLAIFNWDSARCIDANSATQRLLRYPLKELQTMTGRGLHAANDPDTVEHVSAQLRAKGHFEGRLRLQSSQGAVVRTDLCIVCFEHGGKSYMTDAFRRPLEVFPRDAPAARVLVVDDDPSTRNLVKLFLKNHCEVHTAASGQEALEIMKKVGDLDAVVCDVMMPGMNGAEFHELLSIERPKIASCMLFMTGGISSKVAKDYIEGLENLCMAKPVEPHQLIHALGHT
jgi:CheY-like chemotaxis protein